MLKIVSCILLGFTYLLICFQSCCVCRSTHTHMIALGNYCLDICEYATLVMLNFPPNVVIPIYTATGKIGEILWIHIYIFLPTECYKMASLTL